MIVPTHELVDTVAADRVQAGQQPRLFHLAAASRTPEVLLVQLIVHGYSASCDVDLVLLLRSSIVRTVAIDVVVVVWVCGGGKRGLVVVVVVVVGWLGAGFSFHVRRRFSERLWVFLIKDLVGCLVQLL